MLEPGSLGRSLGVGEPRGGAWGARSPHARGGAGLRSWDSPRATVAAAAVRSTPAAPNSRGSAAGGARVGGRGDMEPSPAAGGSETTRLVSPRERGNAGGSLRLKR